MMIESVVCEQYINATDTHTDTQTVTVAAISSEWWGTGVLGQSPWSGGQGA